MAVSSNFVRGACILAGILALAACGGGGDDGGGSPSPPAEPIRLAFVANSDPGDNTISIYALDATTGVLSRHPSSPYSGGLGLAPVSVAVSPTGRFAYVANSSTKDISALAVNVVSGAISLIANSPYQVLESPQHVAVDALGRFAYVALSSERVEAYAINATTGALTAIPGGAGQAPNTNPRHVAIDPSGRFVLVANGTSNSITIYSIDQITGALTFLQEHPITYTPPNVPLPVSTSIDPLGRFVYVANSGNNTVSAYLLDSSTGALSEIAGSPVAISGGPSSIAVEPSGKFAYVASLLSSQIAILDIDSNTGLLGPNANVPLTANSGPRSLVVEPSGKFLYVTLSSIGQVAAFRIDPASGALAAVIGSPFETGTTPLGMAATGPIQ